MKQEKKTTTEVELRQFISDGMSQSSIAERLGFCAKEISCAARVLGLGYGGIAGPKKKINWKDRSDAALIALRAGTNLKTYCKQEKISISAIHCALSARGLPTTVKEAQKLL